MPDAVTGITAADVNEAWALALLVVSEELLPLLGGDPLPTGTLTASAPPWHFTLNNSEEANGGLPPHAIRGRNDLAGARCLLRISCGTIVNYSEDALLADLQLALAAAALRTFPAAQTRRQGG